MTMKIILNAHLLSAKPGYRAAGIHNYIHQLLSHLPSAGPTNWQWTTLVGRAITAEYAGMTMQRASVDTQPPLRRIVWEQALQPWSLGGADLYHAMTFVGPLICPAPMVVTVYDLTFMRYPERLSRARRLYLQAFTAHSCRHARRVIAISASTGRDLTSLLGIPPEKIDVTPLGYDQQVFRPLAEDAIAAFRERQGLPERYWLFLGTIEPRKNLPVLLQAYAAMPAAERLPLVLAGGPGWGYDEVIATISQLGLEDSVHLPGFVPTADIPLWYNSAEVFLYPSVFEGFGLPVLEAMACGTPVITADVSSLPEVVGDAGLCIPPHDVSAWRAALALISQDTVWREQARRKGLARAGQFTWDRTARLTIASYERALAGV